ncbi:hypothetical protein [Schaalia sp. ZJ1691]|uniref:hypothetical protein n=1 Tax=Schaalia sp. ZJ1691 TaxID=2709404 RepID=UPI0013EDDFD4|nr:hypothetical protein [Schaalia sp. ZJ1691]
MMKQRIVWALWLPLMLILSACGGADTPSPPHGEGWESKLQALKQQDISEFAQKVFEDNVITEQEAAEARAIYVECVNASGKLVARSIADGGYEFTGPAIDDTDEYRRIVDGCYQETSSGLVTMYFNSMRQNPDNIDTYELTAYCLVKHRVVEPSYSGSDYENDLERYFREGKRAEGGIVAALTFIDKERGPEVYERCTSMTAPEILALP